MEEIRKNYMTRNNIDVCSEQDELLIKAIFNLRNNYAKELETRRTTKFIESTNTKKIIKNVELPKVEVQLCQATKLDGNKCTAKAKPGCVFCGRHLPK